MGKGDRKTTKGKRFMGSYGNTRRRKKIRTPFVAQQEKPDTDELKTAGTKAKAEATGQVKPAKPKAATKTKAAKSTKETKEAKPTTTAAKKPTATTKKAEAEADSKSKPAEETKSEDKK